MPPKIFFRLVCVAILGCLTLGACPVAGAAELPAVEPRAAEILKAALTQLVGTKSLSLRAEVVNETTLPSGQKLQYPGTLEISLRRPDRLRYTLDGEQRQLAAWYDGKSFTLLDSEKNVCASTPAPAGLAALFDAMAANLGFRPPLSVLLREDSPSVVGQNFLSGYYVGRGPIGGTPCHHLAFQQENADLQFWVAEQGPPLIKRIVITRKKQPGVPQLSYTIVSWDLNAVLADELFNFEAPQNVTHCEFQSLVK
jgi:hypothetical protein